MNVARLELLAFAAVGVGLAAYVWKRGGIVQAFGSAAQSAAVSTVGSIGAAVGLPTPAQTTTDPAVARWIMDNVGYFEASRWSSAGAFAGAFGREQGSGSAPPAGSALARALPAAASYDETERLLARYPAPWTPEPPVYDPLTGVQLW